MSQKTPLPGPSRNNRSSQRGCNKNEQEREENNRREALKALQHEVEEQLRSYDRLLCVPRDQAAGNRGRLPDRRFSAGCRPPGTDRNRSAGNEDVLQQMTTSLPVGRALRAIEQQQYAQAAGGRAAFPERTGANEFVPFRSASPAQTRGLPARNPAGEEGPRNAEPAFMRGGAPSAPRSGNQMALREGAAAAWDAQRQRPPRYPFPGADQLQDRQAFPPAANVGPSEAAHHSHHGHHPPNLNLEGDPHAHHAHQGHQAQARDARALMQREPVIAAQAGHEMHDHRHHHFHHARMEGPLEPVERDEKAVSALRHLTQLRKTPSYVNCELERDMEFLNSCEQKLQQDRREESKNRSLPQMPCLLQDDINNLIRCENQDVDSALYLVSDERKTYKKPCPKQQKAQMNVKALVQAHAGQICGKDYSPLEHPDPDDISPEIAAAMVFCQEKGIELVGCPKYAINYLFPEETKPPFPEKLPPDNVSVVDPDQRQQEEMIEQSASVPSDGVSDSAYSRTMREKGEELGPQRSYDVDFAVGQTKREYVLVAQKPQRINMAQFRGGGCPSWFPGYFSAFPNEEGGLKLVSSPSRLFHKAWAHSKPVNIPTSDVIVLD